MLKQQLSNCNVVSNLVIVFLYIVTRSITLYEF